MAFAVVPEVAQPGANDFQARHRLELLAVEEEGVLIRTDGSNAHGLEQSADGGGRHGTTGRKNLGAADRPRRQSKGGAYPQFR